MDQKLFNPQKVVEKYIVELRKVGIDPEMIILYGSYASGMADRWSDIDLVVISKDLESIPPLKRLEILSLATWKVEAPIEAQGYTPQEIAEHGKDSILWEEIQKNHRVLYKSAA